VCSSDLDRFIIASIDGTSLTVSFVITGVSDTVSGIVADGYLKNAILFADSNGNTTRDWTDAGSLNGVWDPGEGEAWTTTDNEGDFSFDFGDPTATLVSIGGIDLSTGLPFAGSLRAPAGSTVVNPLTTLVVATAATSPGHTIAAATQAVLTALNLPLGIDLVAYDPLAQTAGDPTALLVQKAAANVANVIVAAITAGIDAGLVVSNLADLIAAAAELARVNASLARLTAQVVVLEAQQVAMTEGLAAMATWHAYSGKPSGNLVVRAGDYVRVDVDVADPPRSGAALQESAFEERPHRRRKALRPAAGTSHHRRQEHERGGSLERAGTCDEANAPQAEGCRNMERDHGRHRRECERDGQGQRSRG
jgi:hypothetical protein